MRNLLFCVHTLCMNFVRNLNCITLNGLCIIGYGKSVSTHIKGKKLQKKDPNDLWRRKLCVSSPFKIL